MVIDNKIENIEQKVEEFDSKKELKKIAEQVLDTKLLQKESSFDFADLRKEVEEDQDLWQNIEDEILDFFPDMDGDELDNCLDEIKKMRYLIGTKIDINWLKKILILVKNNEKENNKEENIENKSYIEKIHNNILNLSVDFFDNDFEETLEDNEAFGYLLYLQSFDKELDDKQKKILERWFESMEAWIKEGNVLEIYEISIVDGIIVIKGEIHGKKFVIYYDLKNKKFKSEYGNEIGISDSLKKKIEKNIDQNFDNSKTNN